MTAIGTTDWAYWDLIWGSGDPAASGVATNDMNGGFGIGSISNLGAGTELRGTSAFLAGVFMLGLFLFRSR
ncbi:hypothetical protein QEH52_18855 [Coraliomargarita sp. SDUM461003]|uniref:VPDSG-CTERM protein sorting domain-containing protein n=1 Tax=Thalassobacterium maritimum TaxID=3041265 RepID=A0ABU1AZM2_9BACT|nr:hypothetical protein [Coraliomargarita sp. SDUM461003]MDQ8209591.1 hypothetical protein [Coraliomargarita sp. SDUM461003]